MGLSCAHMPRAPMAWNWFDGCQKRYVSMLSHLIVFANTPIMNVEPRKRKSNVCFRDVKRSIRDTDGKGAEISLR